MPKLLDLFCGLHGWSEPALERGWEVVSVDWEAKFDPTLAADLMEVDADLLEYLLDGKPDAILASPPCEAYSVAAIGKHWNTPGEPKTDETGELTAGGTRAAKAMKLLDHTVQLIRDLDPQYFVIENPRGAMRKMPVMQQFECRTVTYCQYTQSRGKGGNVPTMKPTDLWSDRWPPSLELRPACKNGAPCHVRAPRGSTTGSQGMKASISSKIPYELALDVIVAIEKDLRG